MNLLNSNSFDFNLGNSGVYCWKKELNNAAIKEIEVNQILEKRTEQLQNSYEHSLSNNGRLYDSMQQSHPLRQCILQVYESR